MKDNYKAVPFIPFLMIYTVLSAHSRYFAQIITAKDRNIKLLSTNFIDAVSNIIIVFVVIRMMNVWAVIISGVVLNMFLSGSRFYEVKDDLYVNREIIRNILFFLKEETIKK